MFQFHPLSVFSMQVRLDICKIQPRPIENMLNACFEVSGLGCFEKSGLQLFSKHPRPRDDFARLFPVRREWANVKSKRSPQTGVLQFCCKTVAPGCGCAPVRAGCGAGLRMCAFAVRGGVPDCRRVPVAHTPGRPRAPPTLQL